LDDEHPSIAAASKSDKTRFMIALMLGVRRAGVSEVLRPLQDEGLVRSNHGMITVLNRKGLEAGACALPRNR
jgi:Mn-dependent DtxR family transcriptional regulator